MKQGWTWLHNSRRWHYFDEGQSLCGKWMILSHDNLQTGNDNSPDNCVACRKKLKALNALDERDAGNTVGGTGSK